MLFHFHIVIFLLLASPLIYARDCVVDNWQPWQPCNEKCAVGKQLRTRKVLKERSNYFGKECPILEEEHGCGSLNNGCKQLCDHQTGECHCKQGYALMDDGKTCSDVNECDTNSMMGPCSHRCENLNGSYTCSCFKGFRLVNKHECVYESADICTRFQVQDNNKQCKCLNSLTGPKCDRNSSLCNEKTCPSANEFCSDLHIINKRCYDTRYQIGVLLNIPHQVYMKNYIRNEILIDIESIFEGLKNKIDILDKPKMMKRSTSLSKKFIAVYIDDFFPTKVKRSFTYVNFVAFDAVNNFQPVLVDIACGILHNSNVNCVSRKDCYILKSDGVPCPYIYQPPSNVDFNVDDNNNEMKLWWVFLLVAVLILVILIPIIIVCYKRKRNTVAKNIPSRRYYNNRTADNVCEPLFENVSGCNPPMGSPLHPMEGVAISSCDDNISCESPYYESIDEYNKTKVDENVDKNDERVNLPSSPEEERYVKPPVLSSNIS